METLRERILKTLEDRRNRVLNGDVNCIPLPFTRFRQDFPGIEQGNYFLISGSTKSAKTQLTNFLFIYNTVFYCYKNPGKIVPKVFYFPLEETAEAITLRFMAYLLNVLSNGKYRVSPTNLKSTDERFPVSQEILDFMETEEFKKLMEIYENTVTFYDDRNATGVWKNLNNYAKANGTIHKKIIKVKEPDGNGNFKEVDREIFDYYVPNNKDEYVFIIVDHVSLLNSENGMNLRESINKLSEYMVILRNRYNYIPVIVQQQSTETQDLEAFKNKKIRPTVAGLGDSKYTARDCSIMIGITNPHVHELTEYMKYNISKFKGNIRFLEIVINRNGNANSICPLFFDGAINFFHELPLPDDSVEIQKYYNYLDKIREKIVLFAYSNKVTSIKNNAKNLHTSNSLCKFATIFNNLKLKFKQWQIV